MTTAPPMLKACRQLLLDDLDMHPGRTVHDDLDPAEVGIVADGAHDGGYHCGVDDVYRVGGVIRDYSVVESPRDREGLDDDASALDIGWWERRIGGKTHNLQSMSIWLVAQCKAGARNASEIREVIYSPDGKTVKRFDRLGVRSTGDASHLFHTHLSLFRDASGALTLALLHDYLAHIGLDPGEDMPTPAELLAADLDPSAKKYSLGGALWAMFQRSDALEERSRSLVTQVSALAAEQRKAAMDAAVRDQLMLTTIQRLTAGGSVEAAPIIDAIAAARDRIAATVGDHAAELEATLHQLQAENAALRTRLAAALAAPSAPPG